MEHFLVIELLQVAPLLPVQACLQIMKEIIRAEEIPAADENALATILGTLLKCSNDLALTIGVQSYRAIKELPEDSRPCTYDGLVDVARFCVEEEPGWSRDECASLIAQYPRLDAIVDGTDERVSQMCDQYEMRFPGLRLITSEHVKDSGTAITELELALRHTKSKETFGRESVEWQAELDRLLDTLWDASVERASMLEPGPLQASAQINSTSMSTSFEIADEAPKHGDTKAEAPTECAQNELCKTEDPSVVSQKERDDEEPFLSLSSFRALAVTSPTLEKFFEHDLVRSFRLEEVQWSSSGGAFAWHAAPVVPRSSPWHRGSDEKPSSSNAKTVSLASTLLHGNVAPLDSDMPVSYSRDITPGARGKVVGFLGGLLGEEGKSRMDALADQLSLRLQTHTVRGPISSFAQDTNSTQESKQSVWRNAWVRGKSSVLSARSDARGSSLTSRLAGVLGLQGDSVQSSQADDTSIEQQPAADENALGNENASRSALRGSDIVRDGPEAAVASLRAANEALMQERNAFVIDETHSADNTMAEADEDAGRDVEGLDALIAGDGEALSETNPK